MCSGTSEFNFCCNSICNIWLRLTKHSKSQAEKHGIYYESISLLFFETVYVTAFEQEYLGRPPVFSRERNNGWKIAPRLTNIEFDFSLLNTAPCLCTYLYSSIQRPSKINSVESHVILL